MWNKINDNTATERICEKCNDLYEFKGFVGEKYNGNTTKLVFLCRDCNYIWDSLSYNKLMRRGIKCPKCKGKESKYTKEVFIYKANKKHNNKYTYELTTNIKSRIKIPINCHVVDKNGIEHGIFYQFPEKHLTGRGCKKCVVEERSERMLYSHELFLEKCKLTYGNNKYIYLTKYNGCQKNIKIKCLDCKKDFYRTPINHYKGYGCPSCNQSKLENITQSFFQKNKIKYEFRYRGFKWLRNKNPMEIDFYLPEYNIAIECQGEHHFKERKCFGGVKRLEDTRNNDIVKKQLCDKYSIPLYYINYNESIEQINQKLNNIIYG